MANEYQQNIDNVTRFRDQTNAGYVKSTQETQQAQDAYKNAFSGVPSYESIYNDAKTQYANSPELENQKNSYLKAKDNSDMLRASIDKLPESINQQFGGTSLTMAKRDLFKQSQLQDLTKQFTNYDANYKASFKNYSTNVDRAFNESMDVANKNYDSYWDAVKNKFTVWEGNIKNQEAWSSSLSSANSQLSTANSAYTIFKMQQDHLNVMREFELKMNKINRDYINRAWVNAKNQYA